MNYEISNFTAGIKLFWVVKCHAGGMGDHKRTLVNKREDKIVVKLRAEKQKVKLMRKKSALTAACDYLFSKE